MKLSLRPPERVVAGPVDRRLERVDVRRLARLDRAQLARRARELEHALRDARFLRRRVLCVSARCRSEQQS
jgi:hypothetical protein